MKLRFVTIATEIKIRGNSYWN